MDGAADVEARERAEVEGLGPDALAGEGGVAVDDHGQDSGRWPSSPDACLLGAGAAHGDWVDGFQVAGVRDQVEADRSCRSARVKVAGGAHVVLHVAAAQDAARVDVFELGEDLGGDLPMVFTITFRRPRWLMPTTALGDAVLGGAVEDLVEEGDQDGEAFEREALGAEVARLDDLLEEVGLDEPFEDVALVGPRRASAPCAPGSSPACRRRGCA